MSFNFLSSKTFWGALITAAGAVSQADWSHGIPWLAILTAIGGVLAAAGIRSAIATNGVGSTPAAADAANGAKQ